MDVTACIKRVVPTREDADSRSASNYRIEAYPPHSFTDNFVFMPTISNRKIREILKDPANHYKGFFHGRTDFVIAPLALTSNTVLSPGVYNLPFETVSIITEDKTKLHGYLVRQKHHSDRIPTIILFHGNAGNIGDNLPWVTTVFENLNVNILLFDYRGYGFSEGKPSEGGVYLDAQAAFDYTYNRSDLDSSQIVLLGQSLGGAIVIDLAIRPSYQDRIAAIIIENTFSSLSTLLNDYTSPWVCRPFRLLIRTCKLKMKFPNYLKVEKLRGPTMFIVGLQDEVIPCDHTRRLFQRCGSSSKRLVTVRQGEHLSCFCYSEYLKEIRHFLQYNVIKSYGLCKRCDCHSKCACGTKTTI